MIRKTHISAQKPHGKTAK